MDREQALRTLHERLPPEASFTLRHCQDTHSLDDFHQRPPVRTSAYRTSEHWTVIVQCKRADRHYLEATKETSLADAVSAALEQFRSWEQMTAAEQQKPPKLTAPTSRPTTADQREAM